ncbi:hypothetical protein EPN83_00315 [Patescibacteria group bacterium]|nr:MAG: hypothetical protein EPN83_00315 [Patescibacteria group bacterium]
MDASGILNKINAVILNPLILLLFTIALLFFFWGIFQFVSRTGDETKRAEGKKHILWGLVGMFIMFSVFGLIRIILNTLGVTPTYPFNP